MERVIERGCGLDVHKKTVTACVRVPGPKGERQQHIRTFGTTTVELLALRDWLAAHGVTHVAMESTGIYWKPIFYILEDAFTVHRSPVSSPTPRRSPRCRVGRRT